MRLCDWYNLTIYNTVWWYITLSVSTKHYLKMSNILSMSITVLKLMIICHYKTIIEPNQLKVSDSIYMPSFNATIYYTIMKQGRVLCSMQGGILLSSAATKNPTKISRKNPAFLVNDQLEKISLIWDELILIRHRNHTQIGESHTYSYIVIHSHT